MDKSKYLVWIDLEMTGLDASQDHILEIAVLVTDANLQIVAEGPDLIVHQSPQILKSMLPVVRDMHLGSGLLDLVSSSLVSLEQAEQQVLDFLAPYGAPQTMPLCGNSIWQDKLFLINHMPALNHFLHYRIIDVSTIKELVTRWYGVPEFKKAKTHRALSDIHESIAELAFYRQKYFR
jgi:oligoribonuclease